MYCKAITVGRNGEKVRTISWVGIADKLHRSIDDIAQQWAAIRASRFKRGAFTEEEDRRIIQYVAEFNAMPVDQRPRSGLWVTLEREIGREDKRISERYRNILLKRMQSLIGQPQSQTSLLSPQHHHQQQEPMEGDVNEMEDTIFQNYLDCETLDALTNTKKIRLDDSTFVPLPSPMHQLLSTSEEAAMAQILLQASAATIVSSEIASLDKAGNVKRKRSPRPDSVRWNDTMDKRLLEAMARCGNDWNKIADYVNDFPRDGYGRGVVDANKCRGRWYRVLRGKGDGQHDSNQQPGSMPDSAAALAITAALDI